MLQLSPRVPTYFQGCPRIVLTKSEEARLGDRTAPKGTGRMRLEKVKRRIDFINKRLRLEQKAETKFTELNDAMQKYHEVFRHDLPPRPVFSDFYTQSEDQRDIDLAFVTLSMTGNGGVL